MKLMKVAKTAVALSGLALATVFTAGSATAEQTLTLAQISEGFDPQRTYTQSCGACHNSGAAGAPRLGNADDWTSRLEKGRDVLLENTINGYNNIMPPKGMCFTCSDDELAAVLDYILENSAE
ncbi:Cytochrome c class I [Pseudohongiella spirulinae]|uniref:Cytochrome c class I n=2 Tax=Pseudohongiella spirulinae TaxID=1249552 RepID=A0A0S2K8W3_9GAMM|nr:Cytochrome c class I [Pseudohongiella spirulinae]